MLADENGNPAPVDERLHASLASLTAAVSKGAHIVRVHDVKATVETLRVAEAIKISDQLS
jgi:dihydropteroate synthase